MFSAPTLCQMPHAQDLVLFPILNINIFFYLETSMNLHKSCKYRFVLEPFEDKLLIRSPVISICFCDEFPIQKDMLSSSHKTMTEIKKLRSIVTIIWSSTQIQPPSVDLTISFSVKQSSSEPHTGFSCHVSFVSFTLEQTLCQYRTSLMSKNLAL